MIVHVLQQKKNFVSPGHLITILPLVESHPVRPLHTTYDTTNSRSFPQLS